MVCDDWAVPLVECSTRDQKVAGLILTGDTL